MTTPEPRGKDRQITIFNLPVHIDGVEAGWYIESRTKDGDIVWLDRGGLWDHPARCQEFWPTRDEALAFAMEHRDGKIAEELAELARLKSASPPLSGDERQELERLRELTMLIIGSMKWSGDGYEWTGGEYDYRLRPEEAAVRMRSDREKLRSRIAALESELAQARAEVAEAKRVIDIQRSRVDKLVGMMAAAEAERDRMKAALEKIAKRRWHHLTPSRVKPIIDAALAPQAEKPV